MAAPEEGAIVDRAGDAKNLSLLCTTCQENEWKYKCPGCTARSCSLECVKRHKVDSQCTGTKVHVEPAPLIIDEGTIEKDLRFLEQGHKLLGRDGPIAEAEKRAAEQIDKQNEEETEDNEPSSSGTVIVHATAGQPVGHRRQLMAELRRRSHANPLLFTYAEGSELAVQNQSMYEQISATILWTIRLDFVDASTSVLVHKVPETVRLATLLRQFLVKPKNTIALAYEGDIDETKLHGAYNAVGLERITALMQTIADDGVKGKYHPIPTDKPLTHALIGTHIVEYPTLVITKDANRYPLVTEVDRRQLVEKWNAVKNANRKPFVDRDQPAEQRNARQRGGRGRGFVHRGGQAHRFDVPPPFGGHRGRMRPPMRGGPRTPMGAMMTRPPAMFRHDNRPPPMPLQFMPDYRMAPPMQSQWQQRRPPAPQLLKSKTQSEQSQEQQSEYVDTRYTNASVDDERAATTHDTTEQQSVGDLPPMARINREAADPALPPPRRLRKLQEKAEAVEESVPTTEEKASPMKKSKVTNDFFGLNRGEDDEGQADDFELPHVHEVR